MNVAIASIAGSLAAHDITTYADLMQPAVVGGVGLPFLRHPDGVADDLVPPEADMIESYHARPLEAKQATQPPEGKPA